LRYNDQARSNNSKEGDMAWGPDSYSGREYVIRLANDGSCELMAKVVAPNKASATIKALAEAAQIGWSTPRVLRVRTNGPDTFTVTIRSA
jgi:hypothetical protein